MDYKELVLLFSENNVSDSDVFQYLSIVMNHSCDMQGTDSISLKMDEGMLNFKQLSNDVINNG